MVLIASFANSTKFFFGVIPRNMKCLGEYLTENTVGNKLNNYCFIHKILLINCMGKFIFINFSNFFCEFGWT